MLTDTETTKKRCNTKLQVSCLFAEIYARNSHTKTTFCRVYYYNSATGQSSWTPPPGSSHGRTSTHTASREESASSSQHKHADAKSEAGSRGKGGVRARGAHAFKDYTSEEAANSMNSFLRECGEAYMRTYTCTRACTNTRTCAVGSLSAKKQKLVQREGCVDCSQA